MRKYRTLLLVAAVGLLATVAFFRFYTGEEVDFNAEVRPILNTKCISCHGGVKERAGVSLFSREDALKPTKAGKPAIIPGDPDGSEFIKRLTHHDPEERMPYHAEPLSEAEIETLRKWIRQGAHWQDHWAYLKPTKPEVPKTDTAWGRNAVDRFILAKLQKEGLRPSAPADRPALLRRLSLDLIGLPPTPQEVADFVNDRSANAYEKQVDRLLASSHYGERWAAMWLDLARYADSKGYEKDDLRSIWQFRDYVIRSFNDDKPFDQFTVEQLAGDLLKNPTEEQLIATAYHRNTTNNDEGGTDDEEFRTTAVIDRVNNTWEVWQGTTMSCVQCHSHPYDPFRHEDFYHSLAFFNNSRDEDVPGEYPVLTDYSPEDEKKIADFKEWVRNAMPTQKSVRHAQQLEHLLRIGEPKIQAHSFDQLTNAAMVDGKYLGGGHKGYARLRNVNLTGRTQMLVRYSAQRDNGWLEVRLDKLDGEVVGRFAVNPIDKKNWWVFAASAFDLKPVSGKHDLYFVFSNPTFKNPQDYVMTIEWLLLTEPLPGTDKPDYEATRQTMLALLNKDDSTITRTPILLDNPADFHRKSHVFERGNWLTKGKEVQPATPKFMAGFDKYPKNRLGLAQWLVDKENPLTARVAANRFWEQIFGVGLVETLEDFGSQGLKPSHPELLDYLAVTFRDDYQWRIKKLLKLVVMSETYRQSSKVSPTLQRKDPANRYLARGPRVRLTAEQVRDQSLAVSGLLSLKMYGKSVMPPQPDGVWMVVYNGKQWKTSKGEDAYRRALYTFWRRSVPYPSMMTFDAAAREVCQSRRIRTNTPLQALVTLNDTVYITAARGLADKMAKAGGSTENQMKQGYRLAVFKEANPSMLKVLGDLYQKADAYYREKPEEAAAMMGKKPTKPRTVQAVSNQSDNLPELRHRACLTVAANAILNLDEFVMKE
mgnify:CR=1 FL=1